MDNHIVSYAQNREDRILEAFFPDELTGFYVDIGANHPIIESVTKIFYDKGWHGINVEPNAMLYDMLVFERPRDTNLKIGISDKAGELEFTEYVGDGLSTFSKSTQHEYEESDMQFFKDYAKVVSRYKVPVQTLQEIFKVAKVKRIQFLKVDVEGFEYEVLEGNDWKTYRPEIICIEANHIKQDWRPMLKTNGYDLVFFDGLNNYYVDSKCPERAAAFAYPEQLLLKGLVVVLPVVQRLKRVELLNKLTTRRWQQAKQLQAQPPPIITARASLKHTAKDKLLRVDGKIGSYLSRSQAAQVTRQQNTGYRALDSLRPAQLQALAASYADSLGYEFRQPSKPARTALYAADRLYRIGRSVPKSIVQHRQSRGSR